MKWEEKIYIEVRTLLARNGGIVGKLLFPLIYTVYSAGDFERGCGNSIAITQEG